MLTLHNGLAEATALALPGQPASSITEGLATTATTPGIAPGATARYTFTASRAGTFLYEAGHTAGGARQVAMGLAGALVVLSTDGTAYGQSYDDEAVLVLSEIDPALNADPAKFTDLREFKPKFRLINGKPFPSTDPVATDQAHKVLLRYVNAGTELHPMSLLGGEQQLLSHDGHALGSPEPSVVAAVDPGVTMDSLVTMPSGPEAKLALFESAAQLDNGGQAAGVDPTSVAFGGMLTFLDTNAPPPSTDSVGPASTAVAVPPGPANGTVPVTVTATVTDANSGGSAIDQAELVVDDDVATVAAGSSTIKMTGTFGSTSAAVSGTIPASATAAQCTSTPRWSTCTASARASTRSTSAATTTPATGASWLGRPQPGQDRPADGGRHGHPEPGQRHGQRDAQRDGRRHGRRRPDHGRASTSSAHRASTARGPR